MLKNEDESCSSENVDDIPDADEISDSDDDIIESDDDFCAESDAYGEAFGGDCDDPERGG
jgi:hypothetical protein